MPTRPAHKWSGGGPSQSSHQLPNLLKPIPQIPLKLVIHHRALRSLTLYEDLIALSRIHSTTRHLEDLLPVLWGTILPGQREPPKEASSSVLEAQRSELHGQPVRVDPEQLPRPFAPGHQTLQNRSSLIPVGLIDQHASHHHPEWLIPEVLLEQLY